jgi:hypothetical protein
MAQDLEAVRLLARNYRLLRGFEGVPFALALVAMHLIDWRRFNGSLRGLLFILLIAVTISAYFAIRGYYDRRFGVVAPLGGQHGWRWAGMAAVFVALQIVSRRFGLPVELGLLAAGVAMAIYAACHFAIEGQKLLLAMLLIVMSVVPPIDDSRGPYGLWHGVVAIVFPATFLVVALWDHRTLVKLFARARGAAMDRAH